MDSETVFKETEIGLVPEKWEVKELGDLVTIKSGKRLPKGKTVVSFKTKHPYIRVRDLSNGTVNISDVLFIDDETHQAISKYIITKDDVYISIVGTIGLVGIIPKDLDNANLTENCARLTSLKGTIKEWIYYFLSAKKGQEQISSLTVGTTQGKLALYRIKKIKLPLPPLFEQHAITEILSNIDLKIELNRKMNRTLEAVGGAVFKRWFVDFEFPNQEGKPYKSTGGKIVESELGEIPKNWELESLSDVLELGYGKPLRENERETGTIPVYGSNGQIGWHKKRLVKGPGIIVGRKGNPGTVTWSQTDFFPIDTTFYVIPKGTANLHYLFYVLKAQNLPSLSADSAVPGLNRSIAYMNSILVPPTKLLTQFTQLIEPLNAKILLNEKESQTLSAIRDSLLPKLMSGKIRVPINKEFLEAT